jgi:hypothetical protein
MLWPKKRKPSRDSKPSRPNSYERWRYRSNRQLSKSRNEKCSRNSENSSS